MKISYMLKREDFYTINRNTLERFYHDSVKEKRLYIYPELNAVVTARPSKKVRQYLYTEFRVNGSPLKRIMVRLYAMLLLNSGGLLASKSLKIKTDADQDTLIYPCNKKYRVFEFRENRVCVFAKDGFPEDSLRNEIGFRTQNTADFIPGVIHSDKHGYTETIIDGCPVARTGERMQALSHHAFDIWSEYIQPYTKQIPAPSYAQILLNKLKVLKKSIVNLEKPVDFRLVDALCSQLAQVLLDESAEIPVSLSHGDLQPGNVWVENVTEKLYIIDWESWESRSIWYDRATLFEDLRRKDGIARYAKQRDLIHATVLLEDVIFRASELTTLPCDYGCEDFSSYISVLLGGASDV